MADKPKRKAAKQLIKGQETFAQRRARVGAQGVSLATEQRIIENLARKNDISLRVARRQFRQSQEFTISGKTKLKGGRVGGKIVSRKTGKPLRGGVKKGRSRTGRETILKTRPKTRRA